MTKDGRLCKALLVCVSKSQTLKHHEMIEQLEVYAKEIKKKGSTFAEIKEKLNQKRKALLTPDLD